MQQSAAVRDPNALERDLPMVPTPVPRQWRRQRTPQQRSENDLIANKQGKACTEFSLFCRSQIQFFVFDPASQPQPTTLLLSQAPHLSKGICVVIGERSVELDIAIVEPLSLDPTQKTRWVKR